MKDAIQAAYQSAILLAQTYCSNPDTVTKTVAVAELLVHTFNANGKALICGNGGSACDAMHFAEEFTGRYRKARRPLPVLSLTDASHITCVANDYGFKYIFSRGVDAFGANGDVLFAISTSGNSDNIIEAVKVAKEKGLKTIAFLGKDGGALKGQCDIEFVVPEKTSDRIQEIHMMILHIIIEGVERSMFPENY